MEEPSEKLSSLEQMPIDALAYALSFLPDKETLRSVIFSCPAFYNAFKHRQAYIASSVLFSSMDEGVYQEFVVVFNMKREEWKGAKAGVKAINRVFSGKRCIDNQLLNFSQVKSMWRFHQSVEYFADRIANSLIKKHPVVKHNNAFSINPNVRSRFQRSLYRLDMYVKIAKLMIDSYCYDNGGSNREPTEAELKEAHWVHCLNEVEEHRILKALHSKYSAVEVEQLSSVCGLLATEITPAFNTFLEHDIELGTRLPYYFDHPLCPGAIDLIAQGLPFLYDFMKAGTQFKRAKVFQGIEPIDWNPQLSTRPPFPANDEKLTCELHDTDAVPGMWKHDLTPDFIMREPFFPDPDCGPARAWAALSRFAVFLTDQDPNSQPLVCLPWGYVFWDIAMLQKAGLTNIKEEDRHEEGFTVPKDHPLYENWNPYAKWCTEHATHLLLLSFEEKRVLKKKGKIGYFDFESFVSKQDLGTIQSIGPMTPEMLMEALQTVMTSEEIQTLLQCMVGTPPGNGAGHGGNGQPQDQDDVD